MLYNPHRVVFGKSTFGGLPVRHHFVTPEAMSQEAPYEEIGRRLEAIRTGFTDLSQKDFAAKMGFNQSQWNNWAIGVRRITVDSAEKLCASYGLTLDWVYLGRRDGLSESASKVL